MNEEVMLPGLSSEFNEKFAALVRDKNFSGLINAKELEKLFNLTPNKEDEILIELLKFYENYAKTEVSNFKVSAVAKGVSGNLYFGCNVEFEHEALNYSIHAEQFAIINAFNHKERGITKLAVNYIPCALCRQVMMELNTSDKIKILLPENRKFSINELYPDPFSPDDLGIENKLLGHNACNMQFLSESCNDDFLLKSALSAAENSYAPYSKNYCGLAVKTDDGEIYNGGVIENVSFSITFSPLIPIIVKLINRKQNYSKIIKAAYVETTGSIASPRNLTFSLLKTIAPEVEIITAESSLVIS
ncbi:MAG: cytidine deaminase [Victivallales bacterium]|nr:cytidine deaminase [Victivallales bacterium]